jgi:hypothetical protein
MSVRFRLPYFFQIVCFCFFSCSNDTIVTLADKAELTIDIPTEFGSPPDWLISGINQSGIEPEFTCLNKLDSHLYFIEVLHGNDWTKRKVGSETMRLLTEVSVERVTYFGHDTLLLLDMESDSRHSETGILYICSLINNHIDTIDAKGFFDGHHFSTISVFKTPILKFRNKVVVHSPLSDLSIADSLNRVAYGSYPMEMVIDLKDKSYSRLGKFPEGYWNHYRADAYPIRCVDSTGNLVSLQPYGLHVKCESLVDENAKTETYSISGFDEIEFVDFPASKIGDKYLFSKYIDETTAIVRLEYDYANNTFVMAIKNVNNPATGEKCWMFAILSSDFSVLAKEYVSNPNTSFTWIIPSEEQILFVNNNSFRGLNKHQLVMDAYRFEYSHD